MSGFNVFNNSITGDKLTDDAGDQIAENAADKAGTHTDLVASNLYFILQQWVTDHFQPIS